MTCNSATRVVQFSNTCVPIEDTRVNLTFSLHKITILAASLENPCSKTFTFDRHQKSFKVNVYVFSNMSINIEQASMKLDKNK